MFAMFTDKRVVAGSLALKTVVISAEEDGYVLSFDMINGDQEKKETIENKCG